jgi:tetratricopeptide (TPR) repeat protein
MQDRVQKAPDDYSGYDELGATFLQKARETGDITYYDLAEQTLQKALSRAPQDFRAADPLVHMATGVHGRPSLLGRPRLAQKAIGTGAGNLAAFAIEGDAYTDMGEYDEAAAAYDSVQTLGRMTTSTLSLAYLSDSRLAYLSYLRGNSAEAIRLMKSAITAALQTSVPRENLAWLYFELGERYFQSGDLENADLSYQSGITPIPITIALWPVWQRFGPRKEDSKNRFSFTNARFPLFLFLCTSLSWVMFTKTGTNEGGPAAV